MKKIHFSVIIPAYNEEKYIKKSLDSIKKQRTKLNYEVIVVNNNSTDKTKEICQKYKVKIIDEKKQGVGHARKTGTEKAKGEIVVHIDADTILFPNHLEKVWSRFQKDPQIACLGGQFIFYDANFFKRFLRPSVYIATLLFAKIVSKGTLGPMGNNMAFRKSTYEKTQGFDPNLAYGEDMLLCKQLSKHGKIKTDLSLKVKVSVRRFRKILSKDFLLYTTNFFFLCFEKNPYKNTLPKAKP